MKKEDLDAILGDDEAMKKIAAKVLDLSAQRPQDSIVCKGYFCDMGDLHREKIKGYWTKHLQAHDLAVDENVLSVVSKEVPLSEEEVSQAVIELKTGQKGELNEAELVTAAKKVLADNVIMARKGEAAYELPNPALCTLYGPYNLDCVPYSPNQGSFQCVPCSPNKTGSGSPFFQCVPCSPNQAGSGSPFFQCVPCSPNQAGSGSQFAMCTICGPNASGHFTDQCSAAFNLPGCVGAFDPAPDWSKYRELIDQVASLQNQLQTLQQKLAGM